MASLHAPSGGSLVARVQRLWPLPHVRGDAGVILKSRQLATLAFCRLLAAARMLCLCRPGPHRASTCRRARRDEQSRRTCPPYTALGSDRDRMAREQARAHATWSCRIQYLARQRTRDESHESAARLHATSYCDLEQKVARRRTRRNTVTRFQSRQARKQA